MEFYVTLIKIIDGEKQCCFNTYFNCAVKKIMQLKILMSMRKY